MKFTLLAQHQASPFLSQYKKVWCVLIRIGVASDGCDVGYYSGDHMTGFVLCSTPTFHAKLRSLQKPLPPPP